jgi:transcriptional regulator with XRE-family HTH domain
MLRLKIREVAESKGITDAAKLSRTANIAYDTARRLWGGELGEGSDKGPGLLILWRIARALNVRVGDLYEEDRRPPATAGSQPITATGG